MVLSFGAFRDSGFNSLNRDPLSLFSFFAVLQGPVSVNSRDPSGPCASFRLL